VPQDDRDDARLAGSVPLHRSGHLLRIAVCRAHEVGADKEQDDVRSFQLAEYRGVQLVTGDDATVMPSINQALMLQVGQVSLKVVA
jgi:hypothetical protein